MLHPGYELLVSTRGAPSDGWRALKLQRETARGSELFQSPSLTDAVRLHAAAAGSHAGLRRRRPQGGTGRERLRRRLGVPARTWRAGRRRAGEAAS